MNFVNEVRLEIMGVFERRSVECRFVGILFLAVSSLWLIANCGAEYSQVEDKDYPNFQVKFVDRQNGWILGSRILRTLDGGKTWVPIVIENPVKAEDGPRYRKYYMSFLDEKNGWRIDGTNLSQLKETADGGNSWNETIMVSDNVALAGVYFVSESDGWAFGEGLYATSDGGGTWKEEVGFDDFQTYFPFFLNSQVGWFASSQGRIARTTDGGDSWKFFDDFPKKARYIFFVSPQNGWAVGEGGEVASTSDGGENWQRNVQLSEILAKTSHVPDLLDVFFSDSVHGWVCSNDGRIFLTKNAGRTWQSAITPSKVPLGSIFFVDEITGWAVGGAPEPAFPDGKPSNVVLTSVDGGLNWKIVDLKSRNST